MTTSTTLANRVFAPRVVAFVPARSYTSRRIKTLFKTAIVPESELFITDIDSPLFGQVPFDSPLLGPKPLPKQRKRRSPYWRITPGSAFAEKYYTHDADIQAREKQRLAEMRTKFQVQRISSTSGLDRLAAVAALARSSPAAAAQLLGGEENVAKVLQLQANAEAEKLQQQQQQQQSQLQQESQPSQDQQIDQQQQQLEPEDVAVPVLRKWEPRAAAVGLPTEDAAAVVSAELAAEQAAADAAAKAAGEKVKPQKAAKPVPTNNNGAPRAPTAAQKKKKKEDFFVGDDE